MTASATWANKAMSQYRVTPNIIYNAASGQQQKLDLYLPVDTAPHPTLIYIHGGGWIEGNKESAVLELLPFMEKGWAVVNVEYRLASAAPAPAAVEDCRCSLRWVVDHGSEYHFDLNKIVVMGHSAGGHLALTTGMLPESAGLDRHCAGTHSKVAAIIDWFGMTDVNDLLDGPNARNYAITWLGSAVDRDEIARRVSPLTYVRPGLPQC